MLQDKLRDYEKQIQELTTRLSNVEREKSTYELKCGEMEKVRHCMHPVICRCQVSRWCHAWQVDVGLPSVVCFGGLLQTAVPTQPKPVRP